MLTAAIYYSSLESTTFSGGRNKSLEEEDNSWSNKNPAESLLLYGAAFEGNWKCASKILLEHPKAKTAPITRAGETVLHVAVGRHNGIQFVNELVNSMNGESLAQIDDYGRTPLASAAIAGNTKAAQILVGKNPKLLYLQNGRHFVPLHYAAKYGHEETFLYLLSKTTDKEPAFTGKCGGILLNLLIAADFYGKALDILKQYPELAFEKDNNDLTAIQTLARRPLAFESGSYFGYWQHLIYHAIAVEKDNVPLDCNQPPGDVENPTTSSEINTEESLHHHNSFLQRIPTVFRNLCQEVRVIFGSPIKYVPFMKQIYYKKVRHTQALELVKFIRAKAIESKKDVRELLEEPLRTATRLGIYEFVAQILWTYPDLVWPHHKQEKQSIFHIAVSNRCEKIFSLMYQISPNMHPAAQVADEFKNNILHLAGQLGTSARISGAALQMQRELQWFMEVEKGVKPSCREKMNKDGLTPRMVFTKEHKKLVKDGEKWMKDTASSCTVVAALIVTVVFAAAFTVPGGNTSEGYPNFLNNNFFVVFALSDALGLFSSSTSVLMFLGILTSCYSEEDFLVTLPRRMIIGLLFLFISIGAVMVAFSATLYIAVVQRFSWVIFPIAILCCFPVTLFAWLQFPLLVDMILSTYGPSIFHRKTLCQRAFLLCCRGMD